MPQVVPKSIFRKTRRPLGALLDRLRRSAHSTPSRDEPAVPARMRRQFLPSLRTLEPRFVLNASAELNTLGQLLVTGTDLAETVHVEVDDVGDVLLTDERSQVIPITGHPSDPSTPLNVSDITSGQIVFDLAGGDDQLHLQIPSGIDVTVIDADGDDMTLISPADSTGDDRISNIQIESETITFDPTVSEFTTTNFGLTNDVLHLQGDVVIGNASATTLLDLGASDLSIDGDVAINGDTELRSGVFSIGGTIDVADNRYFQVDSPITDVVSGTSQVIKTGNGTLVLTNDNTFSGMVQVRQGSLLVDGTIQNPVDISVFSGAHFGGDGIVNGNVFVDSGASVAPGSFVANPSGPVEIDSFRVGGLFAMSSSVLSLDVNGPLSDRVEVQSAADGRVVIDDAILDLTVTGSLDPATELVLIDNDGTDSIQGRLRVFFDVDGSPLPQGRTLADGATVLNSFGGAGQAGRITYFGGDGNDVTIVTAGGFDIASAGVTLVSRNGVNLEFRTGADLAAASAAVPVIRPVLGPDNDTIRIVGTAANDSLLIDVDQFFDASLGGVNFSGSIVFDGGDFDAGVDLIRLIDSSGLSGLVDSSVEYEFIDRLDGTIEIDSGLGVDLLRVRFDGTEFIEQSTRSGMVAVRFADSSDRVQLSNDGSNPIQTRIDTLSDGAPATTLAFANPIEGLSIDASAGDDEVTVDGLGDGFSAGLRIVGGQDNDIVRSHADLRLGQDAIKGDLTIEAETILLDGNVTTTGGMVSGDVLLRATEEVIVSGIVSAGEGAVTIDGGGGTIDTSLGTLAADAENDPIRLVNASDVTIGHVIGPQGALVIGENENVTGPVTQAAGTSVNIDRLSASTTGSIDLSSDANEIAVVQSVLAAGDVRINDSLGDLIVRSLATQSGSVDVTNLIGTVELHRVTVADGSIRVTTIGTAGDVLVGTLLAGNDGDVFLIAGDDVLVHPGLAESIVDADDLSVVAMNQTADQNEAIQLVTRVGDLTARVTGDARGDISIQESDSIRLASSDRGDDAERLETSNGEIRIQANDSITVKDFDPSNDTNDLASDREIIAGGTNGRIRLSAGSTLELENAAQIRASQSTVAAVTLEASAIDFGTSVEINTGDDIGVARVFAPRPVDRDPIDPDDPNRLAPMNPTTEPSPSAFFDPNSVTTNTLTQANINDATGILTVDVGQPGERGLTVNIDWGTVTDRFQQIDNVSADDPLIVNLGSDNPELGTGDSVLRVEHFYSEEEIVDSRLNGRESETAPINVLFSVRHHQSILVLGQTVTQGGSETEVVPDGIVSSTDNDNPVTNLPLSELSLRNGRAAFVIPPLSIPVAFFPVRDVIPEIEEPEIFFRTETTVFVSESSLQTTEASASATTTRDEYLQIRMLLAEPGGDDLAPPQRLPDDILDGDKLRQLFSELPDGRYEIEYVLGDGNERLILRVDLRNGSAVIPGDDTDGGTLRLIPLDGSDESNESQRGENESEADAIRSPDDRAMHADDDDADGTHLPENAQEPADNDEDDRSESRLDVPATIDSLSQQERDGSIGVSHGGALVLASPLMRRRRTHKTQRCGRFSVARRMVTRNTPPQGDTT
tara:strand:+ start:514554 stop:519305 length:4752 start_codon:yes stop_codon:yes gene_type:complete